MAPRPALEPPGAQRIRKRDAPRLGLLAARGIEAEIDRGRLVRNRALYPPWRRVRLALLVFVNTMPLLFTPSWRLGEDGDEAIVSAWPERGRSHRALVRRCLTAGLVIDATILWLLARWWVLPLAPQLVLGIVVVPPLAGPLAWVIATSRRSARSTRGLDKADKQFLRATPGPGMVRGRLGALRIPRCHWAAQQR